MMPEFTDYEKQILHEHDRKLNNGLGESLRVLSDQVEKIVRQYDEVRSTLAYIHTDNWHSENCPILKSRRNKRKSWDWVLVVLVALTSIAVNVALFVKVFL